jgi:phosphoglycerol transferase
MTKYNFNSNLDGNILPLSNIIRSDWQWLLFGVIFSFFLSSVLMSGFPNGLLPNINYPFTYFNDGAFVVIQRLIEGWIFDNQRSGYPFGSNFLDFPGSDSANYLLLKLIGAFTGNWYSAHNIFFLLGFAVTFVSSFSVLRAFNLGISFAFTATTIFNFLPFHFLRLPHLTYTWYFVVPIFYYISLRFFNSIGSNNNTKITTTKKIYYALCLIGLGSFGIYYALFGLILFLVVAIYEVVANYSLRLIKIAFLSSFFVFLGVLINVAPNLVYQYSNGKNLEVAQRGVGESEVYGFKFAQLILPRNGHRIESLDNISSKYSSATPLVNENATSSLGAVGSIGLIAVFGLIISSLAGIKHSRILSITSLIVLVFFMFGTIGGFGSIFAQTITPSIRGWNRISIFISFGVLLIFFMLLQAELKKRFSGRRLMFATSVIAIILLLGGLYDQTISSCKACNDQSSNAFTMDRNFIQSIENSLPAGSAIYQLPYMPFPEVPPLYRLSDYGLSVGFLHSTLLHWSYGGMKGRTGDLFYRFLSKEPLSKQLEVINRLGMSGIYIDKRGFNDNGNALIKQLTVLLGTSPTFTRSDGEVVFFRLTPNNPINLEGLSAEQIMQKAGYIVDHLGARYPAALPQGIDFTRPDFPVFVKNIVGLSVSEPWGRWSDSNLSSTVRISFKDPLPNRFILVFNAQPFGPNSGHDLLVKLGTYTYKFKLIDGLYEYRIAIDLDGEKISNIDFSPPQPTSPQQLRIGSDSRKLGIGLIRLRFEDWP